MEKIPSNSQEKYKLWGQDALEEGDLVLKDGEKYRVKKEDTGYTLREYFSHSTPEKGPGPGWDIRGGMLNKYGIESPTELPNEPYYKFYLEPLR